MDKSIFIIFSPIFFRLSPVRIQYIKDTPGILNLGIFFEYMTRKKQETKGWRDNLGRLQLKWCHLLQKAVQALHASKSEQILLAFTIPLTKKRISHTTVCVAKNSYWKGEGSVASHVAENKTFPPLLDGGGNDDNKSLTAAACVPPAELNWHHQELSWAIQSIKRRAAWPWIPLWRNLKIGGKQASSENSAPQFLRRG